MSTSRTEMGIMYKWQIVEGYKRRFFENYYSYSIYLDCHERPHLQVSRLSNPRGPLSSPKNYEYEYDSYLRKTLTTSRHHSGSLHTYSAPPIVHLGTLQQVGSYSAPPIVHLGTLQQVGSYSALSLSPTASASGAHGLC